MHRIFRYIVIIISAVLLCTPIHTYAAAVNVIDYNDYIVNHYTDGTTDRITIELPTSQVTHKLVDPFDLDEIYINGPVAEIVSNGFDDFYDEFFYDYIYLLGRKTYMDPSDIPAGTIFTVSLTVTQLNSEGSVDHNEVMPAKLYLISRDTSEKALASNQSPDDLIMNGESLDLVTTFTKPDGTVYLDPLVKIEFPLLFSVDKRYETCYVEVNEIRMTFSIPHLIQQQIQTGKTNQLLSLISSGSVDMNNSASEFGNNADAWITQASNVLDGYNSIPKPDASQVQSQSSISSIVSSSDVGYVSTILGGILNSDLLISMMLITVSISLASLVLYGKKG